MPAPAPSTTPRGKFVWYELLTNDKGKALDFYSKLLGWTQQAWQGSSDYTLVTTNKGPVGGVMTLPEEAVSRGAPPHWEAYIGTPDVDATVARARQLGAQVLVEPRDLPEVGRFAVLKDPQGAVFAAYRAVMETPDDPFNPAVGEVSWHELATTDYSAALSFYTDLFGWEKMDAMDMGPGLGMYQMFGRGGKMLGGIYNKPADMPAPPHWLLYMSVDDVNAVLPRVKELGGQVLNGPMEVPGGDLIAQCLDPQGAAFAIHSRAKK
jgi:predicted enzyme related to lactoylglutathione lyase